MAEKTYSLEFEGYWRYENRSGVPSKSGVYCVYEGTYDASDRLVSVNKLIYIGESGNVRERISNHEKEKDWRKHVGTGNELLFSFAPVSPKEDRERCEAALIFKHKPPENTEYNNSFPFDKTHMKLSGATALLWENFTVLRTE